MKAYPNTGYGIEVQTKRKEKKRKEMKRKANKSILGQRGSLETQLVD